jgi:hydroxyjasmonate sulfotransferase
MWYHLAEGSCIRHHQSFNIHILEPSISQAEPQELIQFIGLKEGDVDYAETLPSPRPLSTHLPLSMLLPTVSSCGCKIVYICREPKDVFISRWHFDNRLIKRDPINFHEAFDMFCEGFSPFGPFWDHYLQLQYWNESLRIPHEVLFLKYEEVVFDPLKVVRRLASFLVFLSPRRSKYCRFDKKKPIWPVQN